MILIKELISIIIMIASDIGTDVPYYLDEMIGNLLDDYINNNIIYFYKYKFDDELYSYIHAVATEQLKPTDYITNKHIESSINRCMNINYQHIIPRRSFIDSQSTCIPNVNKLELKIQEIKNRPQPEQRTKEWYLFRYNLITASNAYKIFGTEAKRNEIICEKCQDFNMDGHTSTNIDSPMHWGVRYEPISVLYYEYINNTEVGDFGCIKHDKYDFIGASPDGINIKKTSNLYGRMLEIKNPKSRVITGIPKDEYWVQMQLQMDVCDLNYCDFLETKFIEYEGLDEFMEDGEFNLSSDDKYKGVILHFIYNNKSYYEYPPFNCNKSDFNKWEENIMELNEKKGYNWVQNIYWKLEEISCVLVLRNKLWLQKAIPMISDIWDIIEKERKDKSWINRKPKKNIRNNKINVSNSFKKDSKPLIFKIDI